MDKVDLTTLLVSHGLMQVEMLGWWIRNSFCEQDCKYCPFNKLRRYCGVDYDKTCILLLINKLQVEFLAAEREAEKAGKEAGNGRQETQARVAVPEVG